MRLTCGGIASLPVIDAVRAVAEVHDAERASSGQWAVDSMRPRRVRRMGSPISPAMGTAARRSSRRERRASGTAPGTPPLATFFDVGAGFPEGFRFSRGPRS